MSIHRELKSIGLTQVEESADSEVMRTRFPVTDASMRSGVSYGKARKMVFAD